MKNERPDSLETTTLLLYALPTAGFNAMHWLIMIFLLKFATDTLGIAPMLVGAIFAAGRFWDALSDPLAGWFSDRTRTRLGRRRPWMLAAALPLGVAFYGLWNTPVDLSPTLAAFWLSGCLLLFFTALTSAKIPYLALGAELTQNHHERTRIAAYRVGAEATGIFAAIGALHLIENAESIRTTAGLTAAVISVATVSMIVYASLRLREPLANRARAAESPLRALRDVARNPHAGRLTLGLLLAEVGLGSLLVSIPFVTELSGEPGTSAIRILGFVVPFVLSVPVWIPLGRRFGKGRSFAAATGLCAVAFVSIGVIGLGDWKLTFIPMLAIGISQAAIRTFPDSIKADVIDWDEAETGERKEGSYFAVWNLADKLGGVLSVGLVGFFIQGEGAGVDPEGVRWVVSFVPAGFMLMSMFALYGFRLDEASHADLRRKIGRASDEESGTTGHETGSGGRSRKTPGPLDLPAFAPPARG